LPIWLFKQTGGVTTVFSVKDSLVTGARLFIVKGDLGMFTFSGNTAKQAKDRLKESRELWSQGFIKFE